MPTLAAILKLEIRRLASAEARKVLRPLGRLRKQVKSLRLASRGAKRALGSLDRSVRRLRDRVSAQSLRARVRKPSAGPRIAPRAIRSLRDRLHMTRLEFAKLMAVSPGSIFGWETGRTIPRGASRARLIELRSQKGAASARPAGRRGKGRPAVRGSKGRRSRRR